MSEFKPIESQEQLDQIISERLARAKESAKKEFEGYISPKDYETKTAELATQIAALKESLTKHEQTIADKDTRLKEYETASVKTRIAAEYGFPYDAIKLLQGEDEASIKQSAETLKAFRSTVSQALPLKGTEQSQDNKRDTALQGMLSELLGGK